MKDVADVVLDEPDGTGIAGMLRDACAGGELWAARSRRQLVLGLDDPRATVAELLAQPTGRVLVARRAALGPPRTARIAQRRTTHFRHEHKYSAAGTPDDRRFWFRSRADRLTGVSARNLGELEGELAHCDRAVLRHHAARQDLSRWVADVFHDEPLATAIRSVEHTVDPHSSAATVAAARLAIVAALRTRRQR